MEMHVAPMFFMTFTLPLLVKKPALLHADIAMIAGVVATAIIAQIVCTYWRMRSFWPAIFHCLLLIVQAATFIVISPVSASLLPNSDVVICICGAGVFFLMLIINTVKEAVTQVPTPTGKTGVHAIASASIPPSSTTSSSSSTSSAAARQPTSPTTAQTSSTSTKSGGDTTAANQHGDSDTE
jgi:hypothetical protein